MSSLLPGTIIDGNFKVIGEIGSGGMGVVYRALHMIMQREVAIKVLRSDHNCEVEKLQRFRREARIISSLDHPNIVKVYAIGMVTDEQPYIAMEYLAGKQVSEIIGGEGPFPWRKALPLFKQICQALEYAHSMQIIHRDIKPSNILLLPHESDEQFRVKLLDFGIAKSLIESGPKLTQTEMVLGSVVYISPEQIQGLPASQHSDMYSLGCTFFEILTGQPPFMGDTVFETIAKQCTDAPPAIRQINKSSDCPSDVEYVVQCMLQKDPQDRPESMTSLLQMLDQIQKGKSISHAALKQRLPQKQFSARIWAAVAVLIVVLVAVSWVGYTTTAKGSLGWIQANPTTKADGEAQRLGALIKSLADSNDTIIYRHYTDLQKHYKLHQQFLKAQLVAEAALKRMSPRDNVWRRPMLAALGEDYCATGLFDKAAQCFAESAQIKPDGQNYGMLHVYAAQGQWEKAAPFIPVEKADFRNRDTTGPPYVIRWSTLTLNGLGRYPEALKWARRNLSLVGEEHRKARSLLEARALLLDAEEATAKGVDYSKQVDQLRADVQQAAGGEATAIAFISLARIKERNGDIRMATHYYRKAADRAVAQEGANPAARLRSYLLALQSLHECKPIARSMEVPTIDFKIGEFEKQVKLLKDAANDRTNVAIPI